MRAGLYIALFLPLFAFSQAGQQGIGDLWIRGKNNDLRYHQGIQPNSIVQDTAKPCYGASIAADIGGHIDSVATYRAAAGILLQHTGDNKFFYRAYAIFGIQRDESYFQTHSFIAHSAKSNDYFYSDVRGRVSYAPNKILRVSAGIDNQFFGEGYRSLIQGDQLAPNPFAMLKVNFNRLEYGLLYQFFREDLPTQHLWKFGATHYLSYNIARWWNFSLFETVMFHGQDSTFHRGFELEYLNPVVFFRPQEYSLGSSDNVILAAQTSISLPKHTIYSQFVLDEFVLSQIRSRNRWWANKFSVQAGVKGKIGKNGMYRLEGNIVRPYTYAHINPTVNFGNLGRPLAAAPGSNFAELLAEYQLTKEHIQLKAYVDYILQGYDDSLNWGGNVYASYISRARDYGNTIGQGVTLRTVRVGCEISLPTALFGLFQVYIDPQVAFRSGDLPQTVTFGITGGVRTPVFGPRRRF